MTALPGCARAGLWTRFFISMTEPGHDLSGEIGGLTADGGHPVGIVLE